MTLSDLTHEQQVALVALMQAVTLADGIVSEDQVKGITAVTDEIGEEAFRALLEEAHTRLEDIDELKTFLGRIEGEEARQLIYGTVWEESMADPNIQHAESELLLWLARTWGIEATDIHG